MAWTALAVALTAAPARGQEATTKPDGSQITPMRRTSHAQRTNAALRAKERERTEAAAKKKSSGAATKGGTGVRGAALGVLQMALGQVGADVPATDYTGVDLYNHPNFALTKLPVGYCSYNATRAAPYPVAANCDASGVCTCQRDDQCPGFLPPILIGPDLYPGGETCTGKAIDPVTRQPVLDAQGKPQYAVAGTGVRKFVDTLPGLCALGSNNLGNCLPLAVPDTSAFPGSDYYELGLRDYQHVFHSDLGAASGGSRQRGYLQLNAPAGSAAGQNHYLGPIILAQSNRPVRVKFLNQLPTGTAGDLFVPVDTTLSGMGVGPDGSAYTQNRAAIHLHGGNTPWISDGTQHQWTTPVGENNTPYRKGLSVEYVPDMWFDGSGALVRACAGQLSCPNASNNPGDGALTFYWPNEQSGRLEFYHDHAYGITRLNVHAGEAAGYLVVNPVDEDVLAASSVPGTLGAAFDVTHMIPLVIQDKTFVPPAAQLAEQDRTWNVAKWGGENSVWFPHVYTPNQWPDNPDGSNTNPYGRWDYGPWFWPPQGSLVEVDRMGVQHAVPLLSPCNTTAAGVAAPASPGGANTVCPSTPLPSLVPESFLDTPVVNGVAYPTVEVDPVAYRFQMLNAAQERNFNLSWFVADPAFDTEVVMVPADKHYLPGYAIASTPPLCTSGAPLSAVTGLPFGPDLPGTPACWPQTWPVDGRQGGVPDPAYAGPRWIQIGTEAGLLPAPALIPAQPVGYEQNKRNVVVLNVAQKGLFMGPAERADVVVDFSAYAGKTLILYNDAPAPVPAGDPRQDYFTGGPDLTLSGGSPTPLPGYGPNVRTVMQVKVRATAAAPQAPLNVASVQAALGTAFKQSQLVPVVPEAAYTALAYPGTPTGGFANTYLPINATALTFTPVDQPFLADGVTPNTVTVNLQNKALHELFTTSRGRMDSLLGVEIPNTNWLNQTTIPFSNFDPTTDFVTDNQIQIWKVTHNGVDTHTIHFHLLNVQILNRVGWDGQIRAPDANELGWKESVRMNPLEDIYLALRPVKQHLPWPLPDKWRPIDVDRCPAGAAGCFGSAFTGVDNFNNPITVANTVENFGQEYVWHCHLLGHEEEDMLRAEVFVVAPEMPLSLAALATGPRTVKLDWRDASKSAMFFTVQRAPVAGAGAGVFADVGTVLTKNPHPSLSSAANPVSWPGNAFTFTDATIAAPATAGDFVYRVRAEKVLSSAAVKSSSGGPVVQFPATSAWTASVGAVVAPIIAVAPATLTFPGTLIGQLSATVGTVTVTNTGSGNLSVTGVTVSGDYAQVNTCTAPVVPGSTCTVTVSFRPTAAGARAGSLSITSNDPARPTVAVAITGTGVAPALAITPASLTFSSTLNSRTPNQALTVTNNGATPVAIASVTLAGTNAAAFQRTTNCPASLAARASCTVQVSFRPTTVTPVTQAAQVVFTLGGGALVPPVSLTGTVLVPVLNVTPTSLAFGSVRRNTNSTAQTVTVRNAGTGALIITGFTFGGTSAGDYSQTSTCPINGAGLAAGGSCTVRVTFRPSRTGSRPATMNVNVAAPATSGTVALSGTGL